MWDVLKDATRTILRLGQTMSCADGCFEADLYESLRKICSTAIQRSTAVAVFRNNSSILDKNKRESTAFMILQI